MFRGLHTLLLKCPYTVEMIYNFITGVTYSCWLSESPAVIFHISKRRQVREARVKAGIVRCSEVYDDDGTDLCQISSTLMNRPLISIRADWSWLLGLSISH